MAGNRGIYLVPNLLTTAALFAGFFAIIASIQGYFGQAAIAVYVAMVMDGLDGRVARLTCTQSAFGAEFDSLSDMVAFGVAPAVIAYVWTLSLLGKVGWLVAFVYVAATALRLARFNSQVHTRDNRYFKGLSCTISAGTAMGYVWVAHAHSFVVSHTRWIMLVIMLALSLLMVSNFLYYSFKQFNVKGKVSFVTILMVVLMFVLVSLDPPAVLLVTFCTYALSGPVLALWRLYRKRRAGS